MKTFSGIGRSVARSADHWVCKPFYQSLKHVAMREGCAAAVDDEDDDDYGGGVLLNLLTVDIEYLFGLVVETCHFRGGFCSFHQMKVEPLTWGHYCFRYRFNANYS
jgi:hypothetical protein